MQSPEAIEIKSEKKSIFKMFLKVSLLISLAGLILSGGEVFRKSRHKNLVLDEMAVVISDVQNTPKTTPVYDSDGVPIQSEAEVKATTDAWKMNCLTNIVSSGWKMPKQCEPLVMIILKDPFDKKDLSFKPNHNVVLIGLYLLFAPIYVLILKFFAGLFLRFKKK